MSSICKNNYTDCEILAPAGSYQCMVAAFNAGADAVYAGGSMFGARAYADNFNTEELIRALDYAHLREKKLYLTVNTLLKSHEINTQLSSYIRPLYRAGLDAVIVQDMGVLEEIKQNFPDLHIHASTQMTVTGIHFAKELKELGVTRIVTARELSLSEIQHIYEAVGLEIESFVHGALCYSYSGQCLLSSLIGGRSGNRGRCAQPCRLPYELYDKENKIEAGSEKYFLSPKDICTLDILPELLRAGVYSLKIEGRMKKPEYVANVVSVYKRYIDILRAGGTYSIDKADIESLKDIYNRGGFTDGYYNRQNGREMMSLYKPNHYGLKVGKILSVTPKSITLRALKDIDEKDVLELNLKKAKQSSTIINHGFIRSGATVTVKNNIDGLNNAASLYETGVFRTRNNKLIASIQKDIIERESYIGLYGICRIKRQKRMELTAYMHISDSLSCKASVYGAVPKEASNKPASVADIESKLKKTKATDFYFEKLDIELDEGLFVPVSSLNELRRQCLEKLKNKALDFFRRDTEGCKANDSPKKALCMKSVEAKAGTKTNVYECIVSDRVQFLQALNRDFIEIIGFELSSFSYREMQDNIHLAREKKKRVYIALPYICREKALSDFDKNIDFFVDTINEIEGFIARNYEEYLFFSRLLNEKGIEKHFILDTNIYMYNEKCFEYAVRLSERNNNTITPTIPYELNQREINSMLREISITEAYDKIKAVRMEIYGYIPVMTTAGCIKKTMNICDGKTAFRYRLRDRMNNYMWIATNCRYCYNSIYNNVPLYLGNYIAELYDMNINHFSIRFTMENEKETANILNGIEAAIKGKENNTIKTDFTRGHFRRGVM